MSAPLIVTRHAGLVDYLRATGVITGDAEVVTHVTPAQVAGRHVIGVLPMHIAVLAASVTEVPLATPADMRGVELTADQVRQYAGAPVTYVVTVQS